MGWLILISALAVFGAVCLVWFLILWVMPEPEAGRMILSGEPGLQDNIHLRRHLTLGAMGLVPRPVTVVDLGLAEPERKWAENQPGVELWTKQRYLRYLETERERIDGTGNGDYPGCDQRRGV